MGAEYTLAELAARCGGEVRGDGGVRLRGVATIQNAGPGSIAFLANPHYRRFLATTAASALILTPADAAECALPALLTPNPYLLYARVATMLAPAPVMCSGVHPAAHIDPAARIAKDAWIGPGAVVEAGAEIGPRASIGPNCVVMEGARVDEASQLVASVTLCHHVTLGKRALLHPGVVIGGDGFGIAPDKAGWVKVPQLGSVRIGDDVEIGANTTVDRGALEDTVIEDGVKLDNQIQVGHNVRIGAHTAIAGCTAIAGSTVIGKRCMIAGGIGIAGHLDICDDVVITAFTLVSHSITQPGTYSGSLPMDSVQRWRKNSVRFRQLDAIARRVADIEKKLKD
ncbi:MAG TPA: UDP-3-O-(3-hydroxymyristoyl)glucosamine N-acyltransferase [Gammaproteobacteria bacterium]|jgi:UDP-3-O-[3-hydroxymyristoyl] glucosamine N-acyltransferase|nr:UDP-3-O-(3-hydroxymyristoyl)glucosamine N-acyltransferase [Gammaproteobacteria bacterium]